MTGAGRAGSSRSGASGSALRVAAVDLGATSGRIMAGTVSARSLHLEEVHRFPNGGVRVRDGLFWDVLGIHREVLTGIRRVAETGPLHGIGIDSWAIDYGLLDRDGTGAAQPWPSARQLPGWARLAKGVAESCIKLYIKFHGICL